MQSSPSPSSSPSSLFSSSVFDGATSPDTSPERPPRLSIRKRPRIGDLRHYQSTPTVPLQTNFVLASPSKREIPFPSSLRRGRTQRRCASADSANRARSWFASPDRFVSSRPSTSPESPLRLGRHVPNLTAEERYTRRRDNTVSPFRSSSTSRSRSVATHRPINPTRRLSPQRYTPSFVHGVDALPQDTVTAAARIVPRQISTGGVWNVGGQAAAHITPAIASDDGRGGLLGSGTNAPLHVAHFLDQPTPDQASRQHEDRLALALEVDPAARVLANVSPARHYTRDGPLQPRNYDWRNNAWIQDNDGQSVSQRKRCPTASRDISAIPFRVLDAPHIRDDYYCSILAYSYTAHTLAVAIGSHVYIWTEQGGVQNPPLMPYRLQNYVTSVTFSSTNGGHAILAAARQNGQVTLWSVLEDRIRHEIRHASSVSCVSFKPVVTYRPSTQMDLPRIACEDLLVGDDLGDVYYYSVEWPDPVLRRLQPNSNSTVTALAKISAHSQQICGLSWSPDNKYFVTGGNDNVALLFDVSKILKSGDERGRTQTGRQADLHQEGRLAGQPPNVEFLRGWDRLSEDEVRFVSPGIAIPRLPPRETVFSGPRPYFGMHESRPPHDQHMLTLPAGMQSRVFLHSAAVKAIAFAPWQPSLLATGGGSNDRQIHFFHTGTGAVLALINVFAQVTSLIWSTTKREICATFGYAQPEHKVRIAVFAWPSCECVVSIPWESRILEREVPRALWAIKFPGRPNGQGDAETRGRRSVRGSGSVRRRGSREGEVWASRTELEGCIIVAGSDDSIKFHEVWAGEKKGGSGGQGLGSVRGVFGGSSILEGVFEGIEVGEFEDKEVVR